MSTQTSRLANGLRVVSHHMPHVETVSLGVWVAAGARHEREAEHGISHLLEHMAFKGTERRSASDIAEEIEAVGGELNAATSLETTAYFARTLKADVGHRARYPGRHPADPALRRGRAGARARGDPAGDRRHPRQPRRDRLRAAAGRGLPRAGHRPSHPRHHRERQELRRRRSARVPHRPTTAPARMVLSAAGNVDHAELVRHAEAQFGRLNGGLGSRFEPARYVGGTRTSAKPFEQSHLVMAFAGPSYREPGVLHRPGVLGAVRRGNVVAAVPGGAGAPRPLLCDLFELLGAGRYRACSASTRRPGRR